MANTFILASASPARYALLHSAGIEPVVMVSDVDEDELSAALGPCTPEELVAALAEAKAADIADRVHDALVLGCDSMFEMDGRVWGKPEGPGEAAERIRAMRGHCGTLHTGHHLIDVASGQTGSIVVSTTVHFGPMSDAEVDAYVATGEPLRVAGSFTLDGRSAPFIDGVTGDHTNVIGLSLPGLRDLLAGMGRSITDLWTPPED
ncbi:MAG: septum formation inhibitor Maf [Microthrixaceae bacterium]|nr:septum formation inhibitor Maf [Acidimicrobiales bacterium]MCB9403396.1 septum formation inhibitor Maf [Microthrixaceae bacterium]